MKYLCARKIAASHNKDEISKSWQDGDFLSSFIRVC